MQSIDVAQKMTGIVTAIQSGTIEVSLTSLDRPAGLVDAPLRCVLRGRLKREWQMVTSLVVVGDLVTVTCTPDGLGMIEEIHPRRSKLARAVRAALEREEIDEARYRSYLRLQRKG